MSSETGSMLLQGVGSTLLVGLAGFLYLHGSYFKRFQIAHLPPQTRASLSFAYGLCFLFLASISAHICPKGAGALSTFWADLSPVPNVGGLFGMAPILGLVVACASNIVRLVRVSSLPYFTSREHALHSSSLRARMRLAALVTLSKNSDDLRFLTLWRAITLGKLIQVTLKSGKVYIGSALATLDPSAPDGWLKIVPIASGYRDSISRKYVQTTVYLDLYDALVAAEQPQADDDSKQNTTPDVDPANAPRIIQFDPQDLGILITWDEVVSLTIHEPALQSYFAEQDTSNEIDERAYSVGEDA